MKNISKKIIHLLIFTFLLSATASARTYEKEGTIERKFDIKKNTRIEFTNKNSDLQIHTWNKQAVKLECYYKIRSNNEEDIETVLEALEQLGVMQSSSTLSIKTSIFSNVHSVVFSGVINKIVATLSDGPVVNLKGFKVEYVLTLPDNHDFLLKQKYSDVNMSNYAGNLELDLYDVDFRGGKLPNTTSLKAKYSSFYLGSLGDCVVDIYDTDVEVESMGDLDLKSKYSKFEAGHVGAVVIDSYDDKFYLTELKSIEGNSKYSDFEIGSIEFGDLDLYDCDITGKNCGKLKMVAKYSGIIFDNIDIFEFPSCYDNKVTANYVGEFSTISKYTEFEFGRIAGMIDFETYDDKLLVERIDEDFYFININGKYAKVELNFSGSPQYFLDVDFKYTKHDLPDDVLFSNLETKSSKFIASGRTEGLRKADEVKISKDDAGIRKANIGKITIEQYDGTLTIKH